MSVVVRQDFLPPWILAAAQASFPTKDWEYWHKYPNGKRATVDHSRIPPGCKLALDHMATTIQTPKDVFPDMEFYGAGLHLMVPGTKLGLHYDAQKHPTRLWKRTGSAVLVLDERAPNDGALRIQSTDHPVSENMLIIFPAEYEHSVSKVIRSDRRTLAVFYWVQDKNASGSETATFLT